MSQLPFDPLLLAILSPLAVALAIALGLPKRFSIKLAYVGFGLPALLALHTWYHSRPMPERIMLLRPPTQRASTISASR